MVTCGNFLSTQYVLKTARELVAALNFDQANMAGSGEVAKSVDCPANESSG
jgi:hypothetical protein